MTAPALALRPIPSTVAAEPETRPPTVGDLLFRRGLEGLNRLCGIRVVRARTVEAQTDAEVVARTVLGDRRRSMPFELRHIEQRYARMAVTFVAYHRRVPVGTLTLYLPTDSSRTLESAPLRLPDGVRPWELVDIGRLAVLPAYRGGARLVLLGLLAAAQRFSQRAGRRWWVGMTSPGLVRAFRVLNPTARPLDAAVEDRRPAELVRYWQAYRQGGGTPPVPFIMAVDGAAPMALLVAHARRVLSARVRGARSASRG